MAGLYDVLSAEWPIYRVGRRIGLDLLDLRRGQHVLDLGCGTGLNFPGIQSRIGSSGRITGIDADAAMLGRARSRVARKGWSNVNLIHADAADEAGDHWGLTDTIDAVVFTYSLSVITSWRPALTAAMDVLRPGGMIAVVDLALPDPQCPPLGAIMTALARGACAAGRADPHRPPWTALEGHADRLRHISCWGGHVRAVAGRKRDLVSFRPVLDISDLQP